MIRSRRVPLLAWGAAVVAGLSLVAIACFSGDPVPPDEMNTLPEVCRQLAVDAGFDPDNPAVRVVGIRGFAFIPAEVTVAPGTQVVWVNCEDQASLGHTSTSDGGVWDSPLLTRGDTYDRVFTDVGDFPYHCTPHPFMKGTVTVGTAGPP